MGVLFIGLGSIASRHIHNLKTVLSKDIKITVRRSGKGLGMSNDLKDKIDRVCTSDAELDSYYDAIFITNPTSLHYETLKMYYDYSDAFFIEKPLFVTGDEDTSEFAVNANGKDKKKYYVACPLRYTNAIQWIKNNVDFSTVHCIRSISSSYLPDWRPGMDYRNTYSAHRDMGGGVSIDLIHEWDYITYLIGFPKFVQSIISRKSNLEIDADDIAVYIAEYDDKVVEVHLDYFGRKAVRRLELYTEEDTIVADLIDQRLSWLCSGKEIVLSEDRDSYQRKELQHFIDIVQGRSPSDNSIEEACRVLRIARGEE